MDKNPSFLFCFPFCLVFVHYWSQETDLLHMVTKSTKMDTEKFLKEHPHIESPQLTEVSEQISGGPSVFIISFTPPDKTL